MNHPSPETEALSPPFRPWHIGSIQLDQPLPKLEAQPGTAGTYAVLWHEETPLGHLWLRAESMPLPPRRLAAWAADAIADTVADHLFGGAFRAQPSLPRVLSRPEVEPALLDELTAHDTPLLTLARHKHASDAKTTAVSVIICTRDREDDLAICLDSIDRLDPKPDQVIVVDNGSGVGATRQLATKYHRVTYVAEPRPGLSVARNTGLRHATGELIAYTDDDVEVHPRWIGALAVAFDRARDQRRDRAGSACGTQHARPVDLRGRRGRERTRLPTMRL